MPIISHCDLPTFKRLASEGCAVLDKDRAAKQDIRELHIGFLNMMPDAALEATERQFFRLVGDSNQITQFRMHTFTLPQIPRGEKAQAHIEEYYESFEDIKKQGLDVLIITGANVKGADLTKQDFWQPLQDVMDWAWENVTSTLCSCLATHAVMQFRYNQARAAIKSGEKCWGVFKHKTLGNHPLTRGMNNVFDAPHSRFNEITPRQFEDAGMQILAQSDVGVHLAASPDGFRILCMQGHPEYDTISLMKEYEREVTLHKSGDRKDAPPQPKNYSPNENTWRDSARTLIGNWIGLAYQVTNMDRTKQFMDGVDPKNPLKLL